MLTPGLKCPPDVCAVTCDTTAIRTRCEERGRSNTDNEREQDTHGIGYADLEDRGETLRIGGIEMVRCCGANTCRSSLVMHYNRAQKGMRRAPKDKEEHSKL